MAKFIAYDTGRGNKMLWVNPRSFRRLEEAIQWAEVEVPKAIPRKMDDLVHRMALVNQMYARKMSWGPSDPNERSPGQAWKIPVRRISGRYYLGWKIKHRTLGWYTLYNDSREAYFIEFGISQVGYSWAVKGDRIERLGARRTPERRIRRPIRKLSLRKTMIYLMTTHVYHRIWCEIYAGPDGSGHKGAGFTQHVQSPGKGGFTGPTIGTKLPG